MGNTVGPNAQFRPGFPGLFVVRTVLVQPAPNCRFTRLAFVAFHLPFICRCSACLQRTRAGSGSSLTTSAGSRHTFPFRLPEPALTSQGAGGGSGGSLSRRSRRSGPPLALFVSVSLHHNDGMTRQTALRSHGTMMTRANSRHRREAGSLISLPVTHVEDHDPDKHSRTGHRRHDGRRGLRRQNSSYPI